MDSRLSSARPAQPEPFAPARHAALDVLFAIRRREEQLVSWAAPAWLVAAAALILAVWAVTVYMRADMLLMYGDAIGHLFVARRTIDSATPSFSQLGTVWLPLQHVLMLPFIWNDTLWHDGLAGSIISVIAFVLATVYVYRTALALTGYGVPSLLVAALFATNANLLYLQATPMSEPLTLFFITAVTYHVLRWAQHRSLFHLAASAAFVLGASLTRYETWILIPAGLGVVALTTYLHERDRRRVEGLAIAWAFVAVYGIVLWLIYNWTIFGSPTAFTSGEGTGSGLASDLQAAGLLEYPGDPLLAATTFGWAVLDNLGLPLVLLGVAGFIALMAGRAPLAVKLAAAMPLSIFAFEVVSLANGQNVLWTPHTNPAGFYNERYGLLMLPAAVVGAAYLARVLPLVGSAALAAILIPQVLGIPGWSYQPPDMSSHLVELSEAEHVYVSNTISDAWVDDNFPVLRGSNAAAITEASVNAAVGDHTVEDAPEFLRAQATSGDILISEQAAASTLMLYSHLPLSRFIHQGNKPHFVEEIAAPGRRAEWLIYEPEQPNDQLHALLDQGPPAGFSLVYDSGSFRMFRQDLDARDPARPDGVAADARLVDYDTVLGRVTPDSPVVLQGIDCNGGLATLRATPYTIYTKQACESVPAVANFGGPLRVTIERGFGATITLDFGASRRTVTLAAEEAWLRTPPSEPSSAAAAP